MKRFIVQRIVMNTGPMQRPCEVAVNAVLFYRKNQYGFYGTQKRTASH